ncbi:hypothetical protein V5E97_06030 [Singulisphaera sp. Ch08]|uniref:Uncharacterized protein n=1 Tax=Singulisphaera sp. Ch08 TaxID=3120278 RepID=A0AAU7CKC2_9BACT
MRKRPVLVLVLLALLAFATRSRSQLDASPRSTVPLMELLRYEPTGLSLLSPYARGKISVLFIHRLWRSPSSWHRMIATLEEAPEIAGRYQFWTFGYSTGDPISRTRPTCCDGTGRNCVGSSTPTGPTRRSTGWSWSGTAWADCSRR